MATLWKAVEGDLMTLSAEARRALPVVKDAAERVVYDMRGLQSKGPSTDALAALTPEALASVKTQWLQPFIFACNHADAPTKVVSIALTAIQRLVSSDGVNAADLPSLARVLEIQADNPSEDVRRRVLSTLPLLLSQSGSAPDAKLLGQVMALCFYFLREKGGSSGSGQASSSSGGSSSSTSTLRRAAVATAQQTVALMFDRAVRELQVLGVQASVEASEGGRSGGPGGAASASPPSVLSACRLFLQDMCLLTGGLPTQWMKRGTAVPRVLAADFLELALREHAVLFTSLPPFSSTAAALIVPLLLRQLPSQASFPLALRFFRIARSVLLNLHTVIPAQCRALLSLLVRMVHASANGQDLGADAAVKLGRFGSAGARILTGAHRALGAEGASGAAVAAGSFSPPRPTASAPGPNDASSSTTFATGADESGMLVAVSAIRVDSLPLWKCTLLMETLVAVMAQPTTVVSLYATFDGKVAGGPPPGQAKSVEHLVGALQELTTRLVGNLPAASPGCRVRALRSLRFMLDESATRTSSGSGGGERDEPLLVEGDEGEGGRQRDEFTISAGEVDAAADLHTRRLLAGLTCGDADAHVYTSSAGGIAQAVATTPLPQQPGGTQASQNVSVGGLAAAAVGGAFSLLASGTSLLAGAVSGSRSGGGGESGDGSGGGGVGGQQDVVLPPFLNAAQLAVLCVEVMVSITAGAVLACCACVGSDIPVHLLPWAGEERVWQVKWTGKESVVMGAAAPPPASPAKSRHVEVSDVTVDAQALRQMLGADAAARLGCARSLLSAACKPTASALLFALDRCDPSVWAEASSSEEAQPAGGLAAQLLTLPASSVSSLPLAITACLQSLAIAAIAMGRPSALGSVTGVAGARARNAAASNVESALTALCRAATPGWAPASVLAMLAPDERPAPVTSPLALTPRYALAVRAVLNVAHRAGAGMTAQAWALLFECVAGLTRLLSAVKIAAGQNVGLRSERPGASVLQPAPNSGLLSPEAVQGGGEHSTLLDQLRDGVLVAPRGSAPPPSPGDPHPLLMSALEYTLMQGGGGAAGASRYSSRTSFGGSFTEGTGRQSFGAAGNAESDASDAALRRATSWSEAHAGAVPHALEVEVAGLDAAIKLLITCTSHLPPSSLTEVVSALSELTVSAFADSATAELSGAGGEGAGGLPIDLNSPPGTPSNTGDVSRGGSKSASRSSGPIRSTPNPEASFTMEALAADEAREIVARDASLREREREAARGQAPPAGVSETGVSFMSGSVNTGASMRASAAMAAPITVLGTPGGGGQGGAQGGGGLAPGLAVSGSAPPFPLARLVDVAGANLWRLGMVWQPAAALLRVLARSTVPSVRAFGLATLADLAIAVMTGLGTSPPDGVVGSDDGRSGTVSSSVPSHDGLLAPLADFWRSPYAATRADCLRCAHRIVEEAGRALAARASPASPPSTAWSVLTSLLHCVACMGVGLEPTGAGLDLDSHVGQGDVEDVQGTACLQLACAGLHACVLECRDSHGGSLYAARPALLAESFRTVQLLCDDFLPTLPAPTLALLLLDLSLFARQNVEPNLALTSVNLMWRVGEAVAHEKAVQAGGFADAGQQRLECLRDLPASHSDALYQTLWYGVFSTLLSLCNDSDGVRLPFPTPPGEGEEPPTPALQLRDVTLPSRTRPDVRNSAVQALFACVTSHGRPGVMSDAQWQAVFPAPGALVDLVLRLTTVAQENLACDAPVVGEAVGRKRGGLSGSGAWAGREGGGGGGGEEEEGDEEGRSKGALVRLPVHHTRDTVGKQWSETRILVYQNLTRMLTECFRRIAPLPWFREAWEGVLAVLQTSVTGRLESEGGAAGGALTITEPTDVSIAAIGCMQDLALAVVVPSGPAAPADAESYSLDMRVVDGALVHAAVSGGGGGKDKGGAGAAGTSSSPLASVTLGIPASFRDALWREVQTSLSCLVDCLAVTTDEDEAVAVALLDTLVNIATAAGPNPSTGGSGSASTALAASTAETPGRFGYLLALVWNILDARRAIRWAAANTAAAMGNTTVSPEELAGPKLDTSTNLERAVLRCLERAAASLGVIEALSISSGKQGGAARVTSDAYACLLELTRRLAVLDDASYAAPYARGAARPVLPPIPTILGAADAAVRGTPASPSTPFKRPARAQTGAETGVVDLAIPPSSLAVSAARFFARLYVTGGRPEFGASSGLPSAPGGDGLQRALAASFHSTVSILASSLLQIRQSSDRAVSALEAYAASKGKGGTGGAFALPGANGVSGGSGGPDASVLRAMPSLLAALDSASKKESSTSSLLLPRDTVHPIKLWGFGLGGGYGSGGGQGGALASALPLSVADMTRAKKSATRAVAYAGSLQAALVITVQHRLWSSGGGSDAGPDVLFARLEVASGLLGTLEGLLRWPPGAGSGTPHGQAGGDVATSVSAPTRRGVSADPFADIAHFTERVTAVLEAHTLDETEEAGEGEGGAGRLVSAAQAFSACHASAAGPAANALAGITSGASMRACAADGRLGAGLRSIGWAPLQGGAPPAHSTAQPVTFAQFVGQAVLQAAGLTSTGGTLSSGGGGGGTATGPVTSGGGTGLNLDAERFLLSSVVESWRAAGKSESVVVSHAFVILTRRLLSLLTAGCTPLWAWHAPPTTPSSSPNATSGAVTSLLTGGGGGASAGGCVQPDDERRARALARVCFLTLLTLACEAGCTRARRAEEEEGGVQHAVASEVAAYARTVVLHSACHAVVAHASLCQAGGVGGGGSPSSALPPTPLTLDALACSDVLLSMVRGRAGPGASGAALLLRLLQEEGSSGTTSPSSLACITTRGEYGLVWTATRWLVTCPELPLRLLASHLLKQIGPGSRAFAAAQGTTREGGGGEEDDAEGGLPGGPAQLHGGYGGGSSPGATVSRPRGESGRGTVSRSA